MMRGETTTVTVLDPVDFELLRLLRPIVGPTITVLGGTEALIPEIRRAGYVRIQRAADAALPLTASLVVAVGPVRGLDRYRQIGGRDAVAILMQDRAARRLEATVRERPIATKRRVESMLDLLPKYEPGHEAAMRDELDAPAPGEEGDELDLLAVRLRMLLLDRLSLLDDRRTSLRALTWPGRLRLHWWRSARLGVLYQHAPEPLRVPRRWAISRPPQAAPTISIVTPSYGQGEFLERTIRSVTEQRYPALEYVVQDGGSTDGTVNVLRRYESVITDWESAPDGGQANAINRGFARTSGEIMAWLNADDVLLPGALDAVGRYFERHPAVDAVYGHRVLIDADDRRVGIWVVPRHDPAMLTWTDCVPQETLFWRRTLWERVEGLDESFRFALDWDLLIRFQAAGARIVRLNRFLGAFRVHPAQKTQDLSGLGEEESDLLRARYHGRPVSADEAHRRLQPYLRRHVVHHTLHRLAARAPAPRMPVPWLRQ